MKCHKCDENSEVLFGCGIGKHICLPCKRKLVKENEIGEGTQQRITEEINGMIQKFNA